MTTFDLIGKYKVDKSTTLKDPTVNILQANYDFTSMKLTVIAEFKNGQYQHVRECDPVDFIVALSEQDLINAVTSQLTLKKA